VVAWKETILAAEELKVQHPRKVHTLTTSRKRNETPDAQAAMEQFHPAVREWFTGVFQTPTLAQAQGWPAIARGDWTLIFAPTGSGKTLTAFLWALDRLMFAPRPEKERRCRVVYISPLKALAVDVERNLRSPLTGIANLAAVRGDDFLVPTIATRSGDTPQAERARFLRDPADILITTPESIYLMLTSNVREVLRGVQTIIVDEVHALVPNKRGAHLALSLERLARLVDSPPQRIGLSATQNPLQEVARYLGGAFRGDAVAESRGDAAGAIEDLKFAQANNFATAAETEHRETAKPRNAETANTEQPHYRPTTIIDTGEKKQLSLHVEVPVEEMAKLTESSRDDIPSGPAGGTVRASIWPAIHPRLLELIRAHRSTLIFVNSRRLAERLAGALNELAGEQLVQAHHGSIARAQRIEIEDNLKSGRLPALVVARIGDRHGGHRPGDPNRGPAVDRQRHAAHRSRRASGRDDQRRHHLPEISWGSARVRGSHRRHASRCDRTDALSKKSSGRSRAAACGDDLCRAVACR